MKNLCSGLKLIEYIQRGLILLNLRYKDASTETGKPLVRVVVHQRFYQVRNLREVSGHILRQIIFVARFYSSSKLLTFDKFEENEAE